MSIKGRFELQRDEFRLAAEFDFPGRGVTALFGPSGCGKTTLLRAIAGLDHHDGGWLHVGGRTWQDGATFLPTHRRPLAYVFQEASLFEHLDVAGNIRYGHRRATPGRRTISPDEAANMLDLEGMLDRRPETLSGGERQRVALARALAVGPRLLLMDEPLTSLDDRSRRDILPYLDGLFDRLDIPVVYVSHVADEVARLADHLALMEAGRIVAAGPIRDMLTRLDLPMALRGDAEALVEASVHAHDQAYCLTLLSFSGGRFTVPRLDLDPGAPVRLRVAARDVSITLDRQQGTSILNIFPATVDRIEEDDSEVTVRLLVEGTRLLARLTRKSAATLALRPGMEVFAQVKSVAVLH